MIEALDLAGAWALEVVVATVSKAPVFGEVRSASRSLLRVTIAADGEGGWTQRQTLCRTRMEGGTPLARTVLPDAWRAAMPDRSYPLELLATEGGGWLYRADTGLQVVGYDPARGALPMRGDEPQVVDADLDGRPGATVIVEVPGFGSAEVYVATRGHSRLEGRLVGPDRFEGRVHIVEQRQETIGASHRMFDFTPDNRPDPARSTFALWRVAEGAGCGDL